MPTRSTAIVCWSRVLAQDALAAHRAATTREE